MRPRAQPIARATLAKFKFKTLAHKAFLPVWSNRGSGARDDMSIWLPELEGGALDLKKKSRVRVCIGHYAVGGLEPPGSKRSATPQLPHVLEVSDTGVGTLSVGGSEHLQALVTTHHSPLTNPKPNPYPTPTSTQTQT